MAIIINDNLAVNAGKPVESKYMNISTPWTSTFAVNAAIPVSYRYLGLTVNINNAEYWYQNSTADGGLVLKSLGGTLTGATNGITVSGSKVRLGGTLTGNTIINDVRVIPVGIEYAADYSATFSPRSLVDRAYVDGLASGLLPKQAVLVATTGDTVLSGLTTIDGIILISGDRILVKDQTNNIDNGVYSASTGIWNRTTDFDGSPQSEVITGSYMWVLSGGTNMNTAWVLTTPDPVVIGVSGVTFVFFSAVQDVLGTDPIFVTQTTGTHYIAFSGGSVAGNGLAWSGGKFVVTGGTGTLTGATNGLSLSGKNVILGGELTGNTLIKLPSAVSNTSFIIGENSSRSNFHGGRIEACIGTTVTGDTAFIGARHDATNNSTIELYANSGITLSSCYSGGAYGDSHVVKLSRNALRYNSDYSADYVARSIPDVGYVTGNTLSTANNGLTKVGRNIQLGGSLTGNTFINVVGTGSRCLSVCDANSNELFSVATGETYLGSTGVGYIQVEPTRVFAGAPNAEWGLNYGGVCSYFYQGQSAICLTDAKFTVRSGTDLAGAQYCTNYCSTFVNRSLVDKQYVDSKVGTATGSTVFANDITVSIAAGKTFGKYCCLDIIPAAGKTPNWVILDALNEAIPPDTVLNYVSGSSDVRYGQSGKTVCLTFSYNINSLGASAASACLQYNRGAGWLPVSPPISTGSTSYLYSLNDGLNRFCTTAIDFKYTVIDSATATGTTTVNVPMGIYTAPSINPTYSCVVASTCSYESNALREKGNVCTTIAGTIQSNTPLVCVTGYTVYRCANNGAYSAVYSCTLPVPTASPFSITSCLDTLGLASANSIGYCVSVGDQHPAAPSSGGQCTINFRYASVYGYNTNTTLSSAQILALGNLALCPSQARTMTLTAPASNYTYVSYPNTTGYVALSSAIQDGALPVLGAFTRLSDVSVTNRCGLAINYFVYKSNATQAFTANSVVFS